MHCQAFCTAASYQVKRLYDHLRQVGAVVSLYRDVVHLSVPGMQIGDLFYFPYGAVVVWGVSQLQTNSYLEQLKEYETDSLDERESDEFTFLIGNVAKIVEDEITLQDGEVLSRLAISHGLAQSVKLNAFESAIRKTFDHTRAIREDLARDGRILLSRDEIRRKMGALFVARSSINLDADCLDTPEFFWEYPELEPLYSMAASYLDLGKRVEVLNRRLDVVHELFQMLGGELNHQHSSRLEWTIILLIVAEVALSILRDVLRIL